VVGKIETGAVLAAGGDVVRLVGRARASMDDHDHRMLARSIDFLRPDEPPLCAIRVVRPVHAPGRYLRTERGIVVRRRLELREAPDGDLRRMREIAED